MTLVCTGQETAPDPRDLVRRSLQKDRLNANRAKDYTYVYRTETREFDKSGKVTKTESSTYDVIMIGKEPVRKLIAKDDKPLSEKDARKAQEGFDKAIRRHESRSEKPEKEDDSKDLLREIPDAYDFSLIGPAVMDGQPVWVIDAKPKPGYKGKVRRWELLTKFQGRFWIDQKEYQWVRAEIESIAPVTIAWFLAKLDPGAKLMFQQTRVNSELWLPSHANIAGSAHLGFLSIRNETVFTWKDYRKYRTDSRIVSTAEALVDPPASRP